MIFRKDLIGQPFGFFDDTDLLVLRSVEITDRCPSRYDSEKKASLSERKVRLDYAKGPNGRIVMIHDCDPGQDTGSCTSCNIELETMDFSYSGFSLVRTYASGFGLEIEDFWKIILDQAPFELPKQVQTELRQLVVTIVAEAKKIEEADVTDELQVGADWEAIQVGLKNSVLGGLAEMPDDFDFSKMSVVYLYDTIVGQLTGKMTEVELLQSFPMPRGDVRVVIEPRNGFEGGSLTFGGPVIEPIGAYVIQTLHHLDAFDQKSVSGYRYKEPDEFFEITDWNPVTRYLQIVLKVDVKKLPR